MRWIETRRRWLRLVISDLLFPARYWKFIKEIKIQADTSKHRIVSSRVDLIFQMYCLLAFKLVEDADKVFSAELEPSDFVHILVYLGCHAFPKNSRTSLIDRVRILVEKSVVWAMVMFGTGIWRCGWDGPHAVEPVDGHTPLLWCGAFS